MPSFRERTEKNISHFYLYVCRDIGETSASTSTDDEEFHDAVRPITMEDLLTSFRKLKTSKLHTGTLNSVRLDLD